MRKRSLIRHVVCTTSKRTATVIRVNASGTYEVNCYQFGVNAGIGAFNVHDADEAIKLATSYALTGAL